MSDLVSYLDMDLSCKAYFSKMTFVGEKVNYHSIRNLIEKSKFFCHFLGFFVCPWGYKEFSRLF